MITKSESLSIPDRKINWKSSLDTRCHAELQALQDAMKIFYATSHSYYVDIDYTADTWTDETQLEAQDILEEISRHKAILEVGCGRANILKSGRINPRHYTGIDFSPAVIEANRATYPEATFHCIEDISRFPAETGSCDYVFSHYVLEHCVFPNLFLDECVRVLRAGGVLSILCPDFLGAGRMSSQRVGFSEGSGREKLSLGRYWDALVTGYDNKIKIPIHAFRLRAEARKRPRFFVNMAPACFTDRFNPDVDAVYVTFTDEIRSYLATSILWESMEDSLVRYSAAHSHIYLKGKKSSDE
jgi:SAM-dependent methyltransferase